MSKKIQAGVVYEIDEYDDSDGHTGYTYAVPTDYADGTYIGDCWVQNAAGELHPGYANGPMPFRVDDLRNPQKRG